MSQVSKIDSIIEDIETSVQVDYDEVKQALLSAILEIKPKYKTASDFLTVPYASASKPVRDMANGMRDGYNDAIDEWEQNIKELFGEK